MAWTTPRTWVASEVVTASLLNTHVRDNLAAIGDPWAAWTPTLIEGWTLGNGTLAGNVLQAGKLVIFRLAFTFGSTTAPSGNLVFTLPVTAASGIPTPLGNASLFDTSATARRHWAAFLTGTAKFQIADPSDTRVTPTAPWTWATGDTITVTGRYEAA